MRRGGTTIEPIDRPVELRIHGVGGAKPAEVLGVERVKLADYSEPTDNATGFYVSEDESERFVDDPDRQVEAYSWGGLTRAAASRAAWLILAPFALTNLAGWMIEHDGDATDALRDLTVSDLLSRTLARLIALTMTTSAVFLACRASFDILVIQCGSDAACYDRWWLWPIGLFAGHPGRQLLVGAVLPLALLSAVAFLTRRSQLASTPAADTTLESDPTFADSWKNPGFWTRFGVSHRLGISHLAAGVAVIGILLAGNADQIARVPGSPLVPFGIVIVIVSAVLINVLRLPAAVFWVLLGVSSAYLLATAVRLTTLAPGAFLEGASTGMVLDAANTTGQVGLIALLFVTTWRGNSGRHARRSAVEGRLYRWALPPALMIAGAGLISAFGAGTEILLRNLVENDSTQPIQVAPTAGIVASAYLIALIALLVSGLYLYLRGARATPPLNEIAQDYEGFVDRPHLERISRARVLARLPDQLPAMLLAGTIALVVVVVLVLVQVAITGERLSDPNLQNPFSWLETVASTILITLPLTGGLLLLRSYQSESLRRLIGILWDVATFWPRRFHPFAPPSYGERTIPDIRQRLQFHETRGVMLSGHSQGSVLALAAIANEEVPLGLVALLTYGSPIQRLYERYFPEYVSAEMVAEIIERMEGRWVNLYRHTDFIGGNIAGVDADVLLNDPVQPEDPIQSHFGYESTSEYRDALRRLI